MSTTASYTANGLHDIDRTEMPNSTSLTFQALSAAFTDHTTSGLSQWMAQRPDEDSWNHLHVGIKRPNYSAKSSKSFAKPQV